MEPIEDRIKRMTRERTATQQQPAANTWRPAHDPSLDREVGVGNQPEFEFVSDSGRSRTAGYVTGYDKNDGNVRIFNESGRAVHVPYSRLDPASQKQVDTYGLGTEFSADDNNRADRKNTIPNRSSDPPLSPPEPAWKKGRLGAQMAPPQFDMDAPDALLPQNAPLLPAQAPAKQAAPARPAAAGAANPLVPNVIGPQRGAPRESALEPAPDPRKASPKTVLKNDSPDPHRLYEQKGGAHVTLRSDNKKFARTGEITAYNNGSGMVHLVSATGERINVPMERLDRESQEAAVAHGIVPPDWRQRKAERAANRKELDELEARELDNETNRVLEQAQLNGQWANTPEPLARDIARGNLARKNAAFDKQAKERVDAAWGRMPAKATSKTSQKPIVPQQPPLKTDLVLPGVDKPAAKAAQKPAAQVANVPAGVRLGANDRAHITRTNELVAQGMPRDQAIKQAAKDVLESNRKRVVDGMRAGVDPIQPAAAPVAAGAQKAAEQAVAEDPALGANADLQAQFDRDRAARREDTQTRLASGQGFANQEQQGSFGIGNDRAIAAQDAARQQQAADWEAGQPARDAADAAVKKDRERRAARTPEQVAMDTVNQMNNRAAYEARQADRDLATAAARDNYRESRLSPASQRAAAMRLLLNPKTSDAQRGHAAAILGGEHPDAERVHREASAFEAARKDARRLADEDNAIKRETIAAAHPAPAAFDLRGNAGLAASGGGSYGGAVSQVQTQMMRGSPDMKPEVAMAAAQHAVTEHAWAAIRSGKAPPGSVAHDYLMKEVIYGDGKGGTSTTPIPLQNFLALATANGMSADNARMLHRAVTPKPEFSLTSPSTWW